MNSISPGEALGGAALFQNPLPSQTGETRRPTETNDTKDGPVPFSSDAAILLLTRNAADVELRRLQEQQDRREEQNAAEQDQARQTAAREARRQSLERQGLGSPAKDTRERPSLINHSPVTAEEQDAGPTQALDFSALVQQGRETQPPDWTAAAESELTLLRAHVDLLA